METRLSDPLSPVDLESTPVGSAQPLSLGSVSRLVHTPVSLTRRDDTVLHLQFGQRPVSEGTVFGTPS